MATAPTRRVPVRRVIDLLHVTHAQGRIRRYREAMLRGDCFPPVSVIRLGWFFVVTDGHKRLTACKQLEVASIDVELWSIARLTRDLGGQFTRHAVAAGRAITDLFRGRKGRQESRLFFATTGAHWRRTVVSLRRLVKGRSHEQR